MKEKQQHFGFSLVGYKQFDLLLVEHYYLFSFLSNYFQFPFKLLYRLMIRLNFVKLIKCKPKKNL